MRTLHVDVAPAGAAPVRLRLRHWPAQGRVPFVLVHGLASNARLWDGVATVLAGAGHEVAAVDLRSHGESDAPADGYDTGTAAEDVAAVQAALGLRPAVVVGQSWGGNVAVRLAARHPDGVAAIGLVDGGWLDLAAAFPDWSTCATALRPPDVDGLKADDLREGLRRAHPAWSAAAVAATAANLRERPDGTVERRLSIDNHMRILRSMWDEPPWPDLAGITVPVLLLPALSTREGRGASGDKRLLVKRAAEALPRATVREYVGGDHDLHAQQPDAVAADLLALAGEV